MTGVQTCALPIYVWFGRKGIFMPQMADPQAVSLVPAGQRDRLCTRLVCRETSEIRFCGASFPNPHKNRYSRAFARQIVRRKKVNSTTFSCWDFNRKTPFASLTLHFRFLCKKTCIFQKFAVPLHRFWKTKYQRLRHYFCMSKANTKQFQTVTLDPTTFRVHLS